MVTMLEIILILGLLFVLGLVAFIHFISTTNIPWIIEITRVDPEPQLNPLFFTIEAILFLSMMYIFIQLVS